MKLLIAGSRTLFPTIPLLQALISETGLEVTEIVSGGANGVDAQAKKLTELSTSLNYLSMVLLGRHKEFPADWDKYGKAAGHIRNTEMANYSDALLIIWDGESKGSSNMKYQMLQLGKPVFEIIMKDYHV